MIVMGAMERDLLERIGDSPITVCGLVNATIELYKIQRGLPFFPGENQCRKSCYKRVMRMIEKGFLEPTSDFSANGAELFVKSKSIDVSQVVVRRRSEPRRKTSYIPIPECLLSRQRNPS